MEVLAMQIVKNKRGFIFNGYVQGACPKCGEWEAPLTVNELKRMKKNKNYQSCHLGTDLPVVDPRPIYYRVTWNEYFKCPECQAKLYVEYSNI